MSFKTAFIDTNIFLHYRSFDEIDWPKILNVDQVEIFLPGTVIQELDKHKYNSFSPKLRSKANKIIKKLHKLADVGLKTNLKPNIDICLEVVSKTPDFATLGLDPDSQDDRLLASILLFRDKNLEQSIVLVAADLGLRLKAKYYGIEAICLPDELKLEPELNQAEKRIQQLEQELLELKHIAPKLKLCFSNESDRIHYTLSTVSPSQFGIDQIVDNRVEQIKQEYSKIIEEKSDKSSIDPSLITLNHLYGSDKPEILSFEISNYNKKLDEFYKQYQKYISDYIVWADVRCRACLIKISIFNFGTCPAENIDVFMHFPDGFSLCEISDFPGEPKEPKPPSRPVPRTQKDRLNLRMPRLASPISIPISSFEGLQNTRQPNISSLNIRRSNSYDVELHVRKIKQNTTEDFAPIVIIFDSIDRASSFQIDYRLIAENIPKPITGKLHVICSHDSKGL